MAGDIKGSYVRFVDKVLDAHPLEKAMGEAVGGLPDIIGPLELALLRYAGLRDDSYLIDIGCGSGRLTYPLSKSHRGKYLGTDLVPKLLEYNRTRAARDDWRFEEVHGLTIPEEPGQADMVCFFSVFTHLLHEQTYLYLEEARRVLRPSGLVVLSFLDFSVHWQVFYETVERERHGLADQGVINVFMNKADISIWADRLGMDVVEMRDGPDPFIPLPDGQSGALGQSVCILRKRAAT